MNYFQAYLPSLDEAIVVAWDSQVSEAAKTPWLADILATRSADLLPRFSTCYAQLRALPRGARRALQRQLARSGELAIPVEWRQKLASSLAGAALLLALVQGTAQAATMTVNTTDPAINGADNKCSLIEAIINANNDNQSGSLQCPAGSGADTIILPEKKTITLTNSQGYYYYSNTGLPLITSPITITGNGTKIARKSTAAQFRIMAVDAYYGNLTLDKVTISGGSSTDRGAGILNYGTLAVTNKSVITGNKSDDNGGGIFNYGSLTVTNSTISKNNAYRGGGLYNYGAPALYISFTITNSTISGNTAVSGAGIFNGADGQGAVNNNSTISGNKAKLAFDGYYLSGGVGGGVFNSGSLDIANSKITNNRGYYSGGAHNDATGELTLDTSIVSGNIAKIKTVTTHDPYYGTYRNFYGGDGGGINNAGSLTLTNSTISGNIAKGKIVIRRYYGYLNVYLYGGSGGGIHNSGTASLDNSSIANNASTIYGGGIVNYTGATLMVTNSSTITGNKAKAGGGVVNGGYFYLGNSSITNNTATLIAGGLLEAGTFVRVNSNISGNHAPRYANYYYY